MNAIDDTSVVASDIKKIILVAIVVAVDFAFNVAVINNIFDDD